MVRSWKNPPDRSRLDGRWKSSTVANRLYHHLWAMDTDAWDVGMVSGLRFPEPRFAVLPDPQAVLVEHTAQRIEEAERTRGNVPTGLAREAAVGQDSAAR